MTETPARDREGVNRSMILILVKKANAVSKYFNPKNVGRSNFLLDYSYQVEICKRSTD